ncbi:MAG: hypothetical protein IT426_20995 [Pirellulales bacterium]|nr:hypothetical protein [Pirellulales bacterium]
MAGDWIKIDHDLPDKPEVMGIIELTGDTIETVFFRLFLLWRLADRQSVDGILRGVGQRSLVARLGGTIDFWQAVESVGWLHFDNGNAIIPRFAEVFGASAKRRMSEAKRKKTDYYAEKSSAIPPQKSGENLRKKAESDAPPVSVPVSAQEPAYDTLRDDHLDSCFKEEVRNFAKKISETIKVKQSNRLKDRELILKISTLLASGKLSENEVWDSVEAVRTTGARNHAAKFLTCLREKVGESKCNRLLAQTEIPEGML